MSEAASVIDQEHFPGGLIGRGCSEQSFLLTPCISRPGPPGQEIHALPLHSKLLWLVFSLAKYISIRNPQQGTLVCSLFLQELINRNDCICLLNIP